MTNPLPLLTDEQVQHSVPTDDEPGFGSLATARGHLPLLAMDVQARIDGLIGQVDLRQTFVNSLGEPLEATYIFPLPDRAAVTRFRMEVAGRVIEGVLQERAQARQEYERAIQAGHRAAITEEERPNVFTLRVGNLMPGEQATVRLTLIGPLPTSDGEATFRFPLVVAPRYIPGNPLPGPSVGDGTAPDTDAVPDASRITPPVLLPGYPNPVRLSLAVEVRSGGLPLSDFRSSLHTVLTEEEGQVRRIRLQPGERLDRDFILRFRLGEGIVKTALVLTPDHDGKEGTFALTLVPPTGPADARQPRDVVFVLDRSGSMDGWKIVAARRALARMVDTLTDQDRFSILAFDNTVETVPEWSGVGLVAATDRNRFRAVEFLAKIEARGGTEMAQPLDLGVRQLTDGPAERERILVLITDGQVGNEDQILRSLASRVRNLRIFTLGIDQAVNEGFLHRLAALGGGMSDVVESEDRLDEVMDKIHRRIGTPVLTSLRLEPAGLKFDPETVVPARMPDLFAGVPLCILGRYNGPATGALALQARDSAGSAWAETVAATSSDNSAIASVWARGHIRELEDRFASGGGDHAKLEKRIVETSLRFSVLSRFTAFVAVDRTQIINPGGQVKTIVQPVDMPAGWEMTQPIEELRCRTRETVGHTMEEDSIRLLSVRSAASLCEMERTEQDGMPDSFLAQADAEITLSFAKEPLNLNGRRYTESACQAFLQDPETFLMVVVYKDKCGPLGKIAVLGGRCQGASIFLDTWVMSCRAFTRRVEHRCLEVLFDRFGADEVVLDFKPTERNQPLQEFLGQFQQAATGQQARLSRDSFRKKCPQLFHKVKILADE